MSMLGRKLAREIRFAKYRFGAIALVVAIGILMFSASYMSFQNLSNSHNVTYSRLNFADILIRVNRAPEFALKRVADIDTVQMATGRVSEDISVIQPDGARVSGLVIGVPTSTPYVDQLSVNKGSYFSGQEKEPVCLVENHFAKFNKLQPGDTVSIAAGQRNIPLKVLGSAYSPEYLIVFSGSQFAMTSATSYGVFFIPLQQAQQLFSMAGSYNEIAVTLKDPSTLESTLARMKEMLKPYDIQDVTTRDDQVSKTLTEEQLTNSKRFALFFPLLFLGIAALSIYMLLSRMVRAQRPLIGLMRALGYSQERVMLHYMSFALAIGLAGALVGSVLGYIATGVITRIYANTMSIPFIQVRFYWGIAALGVLLSLAFCAIAGLMPAWESAKINPTEALRGVVDPSKFSKKTIPERVIPAIQKWKVFWLLPIRNIFRNRRRTVFTMLGITFAIMLILSMLGILDTTRATLSKSFDRLYTFDITVVYADAQSAVTERKIEAVPGVNAVEPAAVGRCILIKGGKKEDSALMGMEPGSSMRHFVNDKDQPLELRPGELLLSKQYQNKLGLQVGDEVSVEIPRRATLSFRVGGFAQEPVGTFAYSTLDDARRALGLGLGSTLYGVKVDPGALDQVRNILYSLPQVSTLVDLHQIHQEINGYLSLLYIFVAVMLTFGTFMAFALVFNTSTINILERELEIATMRTLGTPTWKISLALTAENVFMGLLGLAPGFVAAYLVMARAMQLYQTDYLSFSLSIFPASYILASAAVVGVMVVSEVPALIYLRRMDLSRSVKGRAT